MKMLRKAINNSRGIRRKHHSAATGGYNESGGNESLPTIISLTDYYDENADESTIVVTERTFPSTESKYKNNINNNVYKNRRTTVFLVASTIVLLALVVTGTSTTCCCTFFKYYHSIFFFPTKNHIDHDECIPKYHVIGGLLDKDDSETLMTYMKKYHHSNDEKSPTLYDELEEVWEKTFHKVGNNGTTLPQQLHSKQPNGHLVIPVQSSVDVAYTAYNNHHFSGGGGSPQHFDTLVRSAIEVWQMNNCTVENFHTCLPTELVLSGSFLSRSIYSQYLPIWLEQYTCEQTFIFDIQFEDPFTEVNNLYKFMNVSNNNNTETVAYEATKSIYNDLKKNNGHSMNTMNKNSKNSYYEPMMGSTRKMLDEFYEPYYKEICDLMSQYPCLKVPLFIQHCHGRTRIVGLTS